MSERIHNHDVNDPEGSASELHEQLCAFVLGELDATAAAKVEAALAGSPELREERDRIEATIGLVRAACGGGGESLSPELLAPIERAARPAPAPRQWYSATPFRLAAGFVALAGGMLAGKALLDETPRTPESTAVARLGREVEHEGVELREKLAFRLGEDFDVEVAQGAVVHDALTQAPAGIVALPEATDKAQHVPYGAEAGPSPFAGGAGTADDFFGTKRGAFPGQNGGQPEFAARGGGASGGAVGLKGETGIASPPELLVVEGNARDRLDYKEAWERTFDELDSMDAIQVEAIQFDELRRWAEVEDTTAGLESNRLAGGGGAGPLGGRKAKAGSELEKAVAERLAALGYSAGEPVAQGGGGGDVRARREQVYGSDLPGAPGSRTETRGTTEELARLSLGESGEPQDSLLNALTIKEAETRVAEPEESKKAALGLLEHLGYVGDSYDDADLGESASFGKRITPNDSRRGGRHDLTPAEIDELCRIRVERILNGCRRLPHEKPSAMFFRFWGDNPFVLAQLDNLSTFGVDVDTASYALARRYLTEGHLPEKAQVRTEEFVNYFEPDVPAPLEGTFAIHTDLAPSRFGISEGYESERWMLRVVVRGKEIAASERKAVNLTFVVDTSGSMKENNRLELVKHALRLLTTQLDANDSIAIIAFSNEARMVLPMTSMANRGVVEAAIYGLQPEGSTNAEGGLRLGYEVATASLAPGVTHRVVLLSDGVANVGTTDQDRINAEVKRNRDLGIYLNTVGVGLNNHNDVFLEQLADKGDGLCNYIDSAAEAKRALVDNFVGAVEPIARDVKVQVEFDKGQVYRHRLLGYENRAIADADFRNDAVDAGEIGSGHQVVALYELELTGTPSDGPLATVRLRWKPPIGVGRDPLEDAATEIEQPVQRSAATAWEVAPAGYKRSVLVAQFAEILRRSVHARADSLDELIAESAKLAPTLGDPDFTEFLALLEKSRELVLRTLPRHDDLSMCIDALRRNRILNAQWEELRVSENRAVIDELERQNAQLEARIRELIRNEIRGEIR